MLYPVMQSVRYQQLILEKEMEGYIIDRIDGVPSIHVNSYYDQLAAIWALLDKSLKSLNNANLTMMSKKDTTH